MNQNVIDHAYALLSKRRQDWGLEQPFYVDQDFSNWRCSCSFAVSGCSRP